MRINRFAGRELMLVCLGLTAALPVFAAPPTAELADEAATQMKRATDYFRSQVASHGGYVYFYSLDLQQRWGEGEATRDQIWVQPPGTPTVGLAYVAAYQATQDPYYLEAVSDVANALVYGQLQSGGWTNCIDFDPAGQRVARYRHRAGKGKNNSSLDDGQTQAALQFMIHADRLLGSQQPAVRESVEVGLQALLAAQFPCGGFPQVWSGPLPQPTPARGNFPNYDWRTQGRIKNYWELYTLNDNVAVHVAETLKTAHEVYGDVRYLDALVRLGDFLLLAQMPDPQPAWAQQYNYQMQPVWARAFEPPAISSLESQEVLWLLMDVYRQTQQPKYLAPIRPALDYLRRSRLPDGRLARYYELQTNRPLYMQRTDGVYRLTHDDRALPDHYGWKIDSQLDALEAAYRQLTTASQGGDALPAPAQSFVPQQAHIRQILAELDGQGRWVSRGTGERLVGQNRFASGESFLSSQVFADNVQALAAYIDAQQTR